MGGINAAVRATIQIQQGVVDLHTDGGVKDRTSKQSAHNGNEKQIGKGLPTERFRCLKTRSNEVLQFGRAHSETVVGRRWVILEFGVNLPVDAAIVVSREGCAQSFRHPSFCERGNECVPHAVEIGGISYGHCSSSP